MPYLSELIDKPITDVNGEMMGKVNDVIATRNNAVIHPIVSAILIDRKGSEMLISIKDVAVLIAQVIPLNKPLAEVKACTPKKSDLYLVRDVLDKQIIDTNGVRVVRVNDVEIARDIQLSFLPNTLPKPDGWEISAYFHPAREVAGDFRRRAWAAQVAGHRRGFHSG